MSLAERIKQYLAEDIEEASMGAPDYNPAAGKYASNMEYGMFTPDGDAEVEEIVKDACAMVKAGKTDAMGAVDAAMRMLTNLAEMTDFEEAEDTDVRDRVAREIMSRCEELEMDESKSTGDAWYIEQDAKEAYEKANPGKRWADLPYGYKEDYRKKAKAKRESVGEAVGDAAAPLYDLIDNHGAEAVLDELVRYLDVDQIEDFVADYRRHHEMDIDEADVEENAFNQAAAAAARAHKDEFEFNGKKYKTKMSKATAHELNDSVSNEDLAALRRLAGI